MKPKGNLLIIGGAENKGEDELDMEIRNIRFRKYEILKTLLSLTKNKSVEIITTASLIPREIIRSYEKAFNTIGQYNIDFINITRRTQAFKKKYLIPIENAGAVFFSGGDQARLAQILVNSKVVKIIKDRYLNENDFLLAGTSAGAMALSDIMIKKGGSSEAIIARNLEIEQGLNIINGYIIDTHFIKRGRFGRLAQAVTMFPNHLGIGLGEDTALILKKGWHAQCRGSGMVSIIDGHNIIETNINYAVKGEPIFVENLKIDLYVKGSTFVIKENRINGKTNHYRSRRRK